MKKRSAGFTLIELLIVVAIIGLIAAVAIPNLLNAVDKGKQKRSMADIQAIGIAVEAYAVDETFYPTAASVPAVIGIIDPVYIKNLPTVDGWSHPIQVDSSRTAYTLFSQGKDGVGSNCAWAPTSTFNDEICFVNGTFQRYPLGPQQ